MKHKRAQLCDVGGTAIVCKMDMKNIHITEAKRLFVLIECSLGISSDVVSDAQNE